MERNTRTRFKLEEARYFFAHLEKDWRHVPQFEFYLSAFVSAARSVTWIMRSEYNKRPGWQDWFTARQPPPHLRDTLKGMNDLRVRSTKAEPIRTRTSVRLNIPAEYLTPEVQELLKPENRNSIRISPTDSSNTEFEIIAADRVVAKGKMEHVNHEVPEFEGRNSLDACREYLAELETLVAECEIKFGP
jgi:hypothetical protein